MTSWPLAEAQWRPRATMVVTAADGGSAADEGRIDDAGRHG